jgi:hypothetical protein
MKIAYITSVETESDAFAVEAKTADGRWFQHKGPTGYAYFTQQQAKNLMRAVEQTMTINPIHWISGGTNYGSADHEMELIEAEYWERAA